ncbi:MAG: hypothetical protein K2O67_02390, partial [Clostridia bacterium]|nr:hypothetical protein [Clostridia bacterium]
YYDLRTDKVDELVAALKGETPEDAEPVPYEISKCTADDGVAPVQPKENIKGRKKEKEFDPYKVDKLARIPAWLKACFIKFWFAGAVCYFVNMGLGTYVTAALDLMLIDGVLLGVLTDCMVNPIFRMIESDKKEYNNFMMFPFPFKKYWTFLTNIIYYIGVFLAVMYAYNGLNVLAKTINANWYVAIEPIFFGIVVLIADMAFIGIKDLIVYLVKRGKRKKEEKEDV